MTRRGSCIVRFALEKYWLSRWRCKQKEEQMQQKRTCRFWKGIVRVVTVQQQNQPPRPPQQHQLQMLHRTRYIQKERQNLPGFPLGCA